ncbi:MAG TPA: rhodanese-like domain-containing protein [Acetobacteraceae bacterium]|nr:rhodanese-like domain-containing protein [Acetobacteraceae bacterium]
MTALVKLHEITPQDLHDQLLRREVILVDVREAHEFAAERIHGALLFPLSTFDPLALSHDPRRPVVLQCGSGKRSAMALTLCSAAGVHIDTHLVGGIAAWKSAGLPTVTLDPATGVVADRR